MTNFLPLVEKFHSLQGEGFHTGKSAFFLRLAAVSYTHLRAHET